MSRKAMVSIAVLCMLTTATLLAAGCGSKATTTETTLEIPQLDSGPISGILEEGVWTYKGIPFAAPPTGELRWKEPQPVEPWEEVLACDSYGPACPQPKDDWTGMMDVGYTDEDCLYLNVWTPAESPDEELPVMVWIHGGAFRSGAGSLPVYDGHNLAEKGVVVVTINYRLGALGLMAHPLLSQESPEGVSGNYGLFDQVAALEWVQDNIDVFGGDADTVTVFGESAGGMSILDLMVSPLADGLFDRAIVESGPMLDLGLPINEMPTLEEAEKTGEEISEELGCDEAEDELAALRETTPDELMAATSAGNQFFSPINLSPNIDGYLLSENPSQAFADGGQHAVPLLTGINANEGTIFLPDITLNQYGLMGDYLYGENAAEVETLYPAQSEAEVKPSMDRLITQMGFGASARFTADCMEKVGEPAYLYLFTQTLKDPRTTALGSFHGLEIMYVFGNLDKVGVEGLDEEDYALSEEMMEYWTGFASSGDPNSGGASVQWPAYTADTAEYLELGATITPAADLFQQAYDLVMKINGL
ncbi:MAG: carboxylesterase family protein [Actinobacteria bacterium]|jgi:para-nitrobenzyl esterase|nr:MAG: carboxylesterase family protein [Actinomycetota bacterium]